MSDIVVTGEGRGARGESDRPSPLAPRPSTHILAIETSCDETAAAVVVDGRRLLSNVVATQIDLHRRFGGVFPEVASRQHVLAIQPVVAQALAEAGFDHASAMDAIAVTHGPGLAGSLLVGVNMAKGLAFATGKPLLPVNHLEGHIYSNWVEAPGATPAGDEFPVVVLIVSGGHTELILMTGHGAYRRLGGTLDDAAGEAFDKVARLLNLGFPGGPAIQRAAQQGGDASRFALPRGLRHDERHRFDFSFSGLKTAALNLTKHLAKEGADLTEPQLAGRPGGVVSGRGGGCAGGQDRRRGADGSRGGAGLHLRRRERQRRAAPGGDGALRRVGHPVLDPALQPVHRQRRHDRRRSVLPLAVCVGAGCGIGCRCLRQPALANVGHVCNVTWLRNGDLSRWKRDLRNQLLLVSWVTFSMGLGCATVICHVGNVTYGVDCYLCRGSRFQWDLVAQR
jgi:tRNA threonylcarbamoyl adenosine modification protein TsaD